MTAGRMDEGSSLHAFIADYLIECLIFFVKGAHRILYELLEVALYAFKDALQYVIRFCNIFWSFPLEIKAVTHYGVNGL
jgi:hypothetical protein